LSVVREVVRESSALSKASEVAGAVEKVGVVVSEVRSAFREASKASRDVSTTLSISSIH
jgi:hypothetical protein